MKLTDLFEATQYELVRGPRGITEVMINPRYIDIKFAIDQYHDLRGFFDPINNVCAFWKGDILHEEVIIQDPFFYDYADVIKLYAGDHGFGIYHYNDPLKTSDEIRELTGGSQDSLIETMRKQNFSLKKLIDTRKVFFA